MLYKYTKRGLLQIRMLINIYSREKQYWLSVDNHKTSFSLFTDSLIVVNTSFYPSKVNKTHTYQDLCVNKLAIGTIKL